jgi:DNA-binding NtrC family response regulator
MSSPYKVLVVEDEPLSLLDLVDNLEDQGFETLAFTRADAVASDLYKSGINALITDIETPGAKNGIELAWEFSKAQPEAPIFIVSGRVRPSSAQIPDRSVFLSKPYAMSDLLFALSSVRQTHPV